MVHLLQSAAQVAAAVLVRQVRLVQAGQHLKAATVEQVLVRALTALQHLAQAVVVVVQTSPTLQKELEQMAAVMAVA